MLNLEGDDWIPQDWLIGCWQEASFRKIFFIVCDRDEGSLRLHRIDNSLVKGVHLSFLN